MLKNLYYRILGKIMEQKMGKNMGNTSHLHKKECSKSLQKVLFFGSAIENVIPLVRIPNFCKQVIWVFPKIVAPQNG